MGDVIPIEVAVMRRSVTVQEAWDRYLAARERAEASRAIEDGIAAGKAWRQWLDLFTGRK